MENGGNFLLKQSLALLRITTISGLTKGPLLNPTNHSLILYNFTKIHQILIISTILIGMTNKKAVESVNKNPMLGELSIFWEERCQVIQDFNLKSSPDIEESSLFGQLEPGGQ